jgi:hypothetical protein
VLALAALAWTPLGKPAAGQQGSVVLRSVWSRASQHSVRTLLAELRGAVVDLHPYLLEQAGLAAASAGGDRR